MNIENRQSMEMPKGDNSPFGKRITRVEDRRFLRGKGAYTDDFNIEGQVYAKILRSPHSCANIVRLDTSAALRSSNVIAVYTAKDLIDDGVKEIPPIWQITNKDGGKMVEPPRYPLAVNKVNHVGDPIAIILAESSNDAEDAAELVEVEYHILDPVIDIKAARVAGAPAVHEAAADNTCFDWHIGNKTGTDQAFREADHIVSVELVNSRIMANPLETRAALGQFDQINEKYTLYTSSQNPHLIRMLLCNDVLDIPEHKMRVIAPDVGGGFGVKCYHYPEEVLVTWASKKCNRPVKWLSTRSEGLLSDAHARDHVTNAELALNKDGTFTGLRVATLANLGAYLSTWGPSIPTYLYATLLAGQYKTPNIYAEVKGIFTNTVPVDAYRGAGRPEANYVVERLVDEAARKLKIDRLEIRRKNFIGRNQMPYTTPVNMTYDSGDFNLAMDMVALDIDYQNFEKRRAESQIKGKLLGLGISCYIEACGLSPSKGSGKLGSRVGLYESANIRVNPDASVSVFTGSHSHGQGHETSFAQIVAAGLGISMDKIEVVHGDTAKIPFGMGTYGSRSAAVGGAAISVSVKRIIEKGKIIAAHMLDDQAENIKFYDGKFWVVDTNKVLMFDEVARSAYVPFDYPLEEIDPGLEEMAFYDPTNFTYPNGVHACEIEIDPQTGETAIKKYIVVDDFGRVINPLIVEGQVHGGLAQGIGQAVMEFASYDTTSGQLLTGSFMDYAMPRASDLPFFKVDYHEKQPCTHNPLGVKGAGEAGTIASTTAVMSGILDALKTIGINHIDMPATPCKIWSEINRQKDD